MTIKLINILCSSTLFARPFDRKIKAFLLTLYLICTLYLFLTFLISNSLLLCLERLFVNLYREFLLIYLSMFVCLSNCKCMLICLRNVSLQRLIKCESICCRLVWFKSFSWVRRILTRSILEEKTAMSTILNRKEKTWRSAKCI